MNRDLKGYIQKIILYFTYPEEDGAKPQTPDNKANDNIILMITNNWP